MMPLLPTCTRLIVIYSHSSCFQLLSQGVAENFRPAMADFPYASRVSSRLHLDYNSEFRPLSLGRNQIGQAYECPICTPLFTVNRKWTSLRAWDTARRKNSFLPMLLNELAQCRHALLSCPCSTARDHICPIGAIDT